MGAAARGVQVDGERRLPNRARAELAARHGVTPREVALAVVRYERAAERSAVVATLRRAMQDFRREALS